MAGVKQTELTDQQKKFYQLFAIDFDAPKAWIKSGHKVKNKGTAQANASRFMLSNAKGHDYLRTLLRGQQERSEKSADDIVRELEKCGFSNIEDFMDVDEDGEVRIRSFDSISREKLAAVESVQVNMTKNKDGDREYTTTKFKLYSKIHSLELLAKRFRLFADGLDVNIGLSAVTKLGLLSAKDTRRLESKPVELPEGPQGGS